jgi:hypothetical protein
LFLWLVLGVCFVQFLLILKFYKIGTDLPTAAGYIYTTLDSPAITIEGGGDGMQDDTTNQSCKVSLLIKYLHI